MMWKTNGFINFILFTCLYGSLYAGEHVLFEKKCVLTEMVCGFGLKKNLESGAVKKELLKIPFGKAIGRISRIDKKSSTDGYIDMFFIKTLRYPSLEFVIVLNRKTGSPIFADAHPVPSKLISYGDRVWYFLTDNHRLVYWLPPFPPLYLIELDSIQENDNSTIRATEIDVRDKNAIIPAPLSFMPAASGDGEYEVYLNGKRVIPRDVALFYGFEKSH